MSFEQDKFVLIKNLIDAETLSGLKSSLEQLRIDKYASKNLVPNNSNLTLFHDKVEKCFGSYAPYFSDLLLLNLTGQIESIVGKELHPTFSYVRILYNGAELIKHTDLRSSCEYSVSLCISEDENYPWPLWIEDTQGNKQSIDLRPGDVLVYKGLEIKHWRELYEGQEHMQATLHYVDKNYAYALAKFDGRTSLGTPTSTRKTNIYFPHILVS